ncbi:PPP5C [Lepeophtheirus salmonis]|uniref:protein-serine/threonine phosphatase n=1 Tax=Lepeophtheirus salmonis TaxID=72036 RepID=A0A7R8H9B0_LEPSM|nr:PPP5C [Lepeophtheirus salmonis]CAF2938166.1 PPP5C [Lepeophtheirus salmonis]
MQRQNMLNVVKWFSKLRLNKAIAVEEKVVSIVDSLNLASMVVDDTYTGPRLNPDDNFAITRDFMTELLQYYKDLKVLHRRFAFQMLIDVKNLFMTQPSLVDINVPPSNKFTICGGNHESENMNKMYGFEGEVKSKYSSVMADLFTEVYNWLPLCHRINEKVLVMHGGLFSNDDVTLEDIRSVDRCRMVFHPVNVAPVANSDLMSHEVKEEGYEVSHNGAFINIKGDDLTPKYITYEAVPHPNIKPMAYAANSFLLG